MIDIQKIRLGILLLVVISIGIGCAQSSVEIGMVETRLPGRWEASYATFTGTKRDTIRAEAGQTLVLEYEVEVDKGELHIALEPQDRGALWDVTFEKGAADTVELALSQDGPYALTIEGDNAGGSFALSWQIE